jgi:hypothetical protein
MAYEDELMHSDWLKWFEAVRRSIQSIGNIAAGTANGAFVMNGVANPSFPNAQVLGALGTGLLKNTTVTGALSIGVAAVDYVAPSAYASANGLTMATARLLGRTTAGTGAAEEISVAGNLTLAAGVLTGTTGGLTTFAVGDLLYADTATTLARLADVAVGSVLVSGGVGVAPAWSATPTLTSLTAGTIASPLNSALSILSGAATAAIGTDLTVSAGAADGGNRAGGNLTLKAGDGTGSGISGTLRFLPSRLDATRQFTILEWASGDAAASPHLEWFQTLSPFSNFGVQDNQVFQLGFNVTYNASLVNPAYSGCRDGWEQYNEPASVGVGQSERHISVVPLDVSTKGEIRMLTFVAQANVNRDAVHPLAGFNVETLSFTNPTTAGLANGSAFDIVVNGTPTFGATFQLKNKYGAIERLGTPDATNALLSQGNAAGTALIKAMYWDTGTNDMHLNVDPAGSRTVVHIGRVNQQSILFIDGQSVANNHAILSLSDDGAGGAVQSVIAQTLTTLYVVPPRAPLANYTDATIAAAAVLALTGALSTFTTTVGALAFTASSVAALTTAAESWVGPSATGGVYFKGGNVGIGTTSPQDLLEVKATASGSVGGRIDISNGAADAVGNAAELAFKSASAFGAGFYSASIASVTTNATTHATDLVFSAYTGGGNVEAMRIAGALGHVGIGVAPTAVLHLKNGTAAANTAPLKFNSGPVLTTAEAGAIEFTTDDYFATITTGAARKAFVLDDGARLTSGKIPIATTNGRLIDGQTPLAGTKVYYVSDTSGGAVTRKLTFTSGILTAET